MDVCEALVVKQQMVLAFTFCQISK